MGRRVYEELRTPIERMGGSMTHLKKGYKYGAWSIKVGKKQGIFEYSDVGYQGFPDLDKLYKPKIDNPAHWKDYSCILIPNAIELLLAKLK